MRAGGEIPANRRGSVMKCCWMHELGLAANACSLTLKVVSRAPYLRTDAPALTCAHGTIVMRRAARAVGGTRQGRTECRPAMPMETDRDAYQVAFKIALSAPQHYSYSYNGSNSWLAELLSFHMSNSHGNS